MSQYFITNPLFLRNQFLPSLAILSMTQEKPAASTAEEAQKEDKEEEEEYFEVESVIGERTHDGRTQFLMKWKSFDLSDSTWEFEEDTHYPKLIEEFRAREPSRISEKERRLKEHAFRKIEISEELQEAAPKIVTSAFRFEGELYYRISRRNNKFHNRSLYPTLIGLFLENKVELLGP
jgi:hypothetical protein